MLNVAINVRDSGPVTLTGDLRGLLEDIADTWTSQIRQRTRSGRDADGKAMRRKVGRLRISVTRFRRRCSRACAPTSAIADSRSHLPAGETSSWPEPISAAAGDGRAHPTRPDRGRAAGRRRHIAEGHHQMTEAQRLQIRASANSAPEIKRAIRYRHSDRRPAGRARHAVGRVSATPRRQVHGPSLLAESAAVEVEVHATEPADAEDT